MSYLPVSKSKAFEDGALTRAQGYGKLFNPYRDDKNSDLYIEWLKGWTKQNILMIA